LELLRFRNLSAFAELVHGISDRSFGSVQRPDSPGRANLAAALGVPVQALVPTKQVHRAEVVLVPSAAYGRWEEGHGADALISCTPGVYLLGFFADCVPVLAYDPRQRAVGLAHAGWRGTLSGIARRLVEAMTAAFGTRPADLRVGLGPAIGPCCYEVGEVVLAALNGWEDAQGLLRPGRPGHAYLDLWEANCRVLLAAGVLREHVEVARLCTACHPDRFFSFRGEGRLNGLFGAAIGLARGG
jgi:YfiH family protein